MVARLELVACPADSSRSAIPKWLTPAANTSLEREGGERRVAAGAAAADDEPVRVHVAAAARNRAAATQSSTSTTPHWPLSASRYARP